MSEIICSQADPNDAETIVDMALEFWGNTDYSSNACPGDIDVRAWFAGLVDRLLDPAHILVVARAPTGLVGFLALFVAPHILIPGTLSAHEVAWWVRPVGRKAGAGRALLELAEDIARNRGVRTFHMIALPNSPGSVAEAYLRGGYQQTETSYTKVL